MVRYATCEHPVDQPIGTIVWADERGHDITYAVGSRGVTRIEAAYKSGEYSNIPYVRVWSGDICVAEFCQHKLRGVFFDSNPAEAKPDV